MKGNWSIRPYRNGDQDRIRALFELVFDKQLSAARWQWHYRDNHTGLIAITLAEDENGEIVGQCALRPLRMKIGERIGLGTLQLDSMIHPDFQRQGMFTKLTTRAYDQVSEQGVHLVYSFPNRNSQYVYTHKLGRVTLCDRIPLFAKILNVRNILDRRIGNRLLLSLAAPVGQAATGLFYALRGGTPSADCRLERVSRFDEGVDRLWEKASAPYSILVVRDREYLNWRYVENPTEEYVLLTAKRSEETVGYVVLKCESRFGLQIGFIVDMLTIPDEPTIGSCLISEAVTHFRKQRMDLACCLMLEHVPYAQSLRDSGFLIVPEKLFPQSLNLSVRRLSDEYSDSFITDPGNWFITWGDHDMV
ncbi:MAG: GNAT family N-acetyltransferase [Anaerolineae bacterium]|nr:GNAT family N-acetyltransferase [Anaerolineae bacterium]